MIYELNGQWWVRFNGYDIAWYKTREAAERALKHLVDCGDDVQEETSET